MFEHGPLELEMGNTHFGEREREREREVFECCESPPPLPPWVVKDANNHKYTALENRNPKQKERASSLFQT